MKKIVLFFILIFFKTLYPYINIYPVKFEKDIKNGATEIFKLYNRTEKEIRYRVYLEKKSSENDMTDWIEVYPKSISLKPLEEKEIKIYVNTPKNLKKGVYSSVLVIKEIPVAYKKRKNVELMTLFRLNMKGYID